MIIRKANIKDLEEVRKLNQELFEHDFKFDNTLNLKWSSKHRYYYKKRIESKNSITLIAIDENKVIGYLIGNIFKAENWRNIKRIAELESILIIKEYRGKGIGKSLIKEFIKWAKTKKVERMKVIASSENKNAISAYKKSGFSEYALIMEGKI